MKEGQWLILDVSSYTKKDEQGNENEKHIFQYAAHDSYGNIKCSSYFFSDVELFKQFSGPGVYDVFCTASLNYKGEQNLKIVGIKKVKDIVF